MVALKKYNLQGDLLGEVAVEEGLLDVHAHPQLIKDYLVALRANARQWSANTKGRSEVNHSTKKPFKQKGTGNARQGSLAAPQFRGGGEVFGPKPKFDQHVRINRKERRLAVWHLLVEKVRAGRLLLVEDSAFAEGCATPKTRLVAQFLRRTQLAGRRLLFVGAGAYAQYVCGEHVCIESAPADQYDAFKKSMRNIPKTVFTLAPNVNGYELAVAHSMVMTESAWKELSMMVCGAEKEVVHG